MGLAPQPNAHPQRVIYFQLCLCQSFFNTSHLLSRLVLFINNKGNFFAIQRSILMERIKYVGNIMIFCQLCWILACIIFTFSREKKGRERQIKLITTFYQPLVMLLGLDFIFGTREHLGIIHELYNTNLTQKLPLPLLCISLYFYFIR